MVSIYRSLAYRLLLYSGEFVSNTEYRWRIKVPFAEECIIERRVEKVGRDIFVDEYVDSIVIYFVKTYLEISRFGFCR